MAKEKVMPFVEARARLSEIVDRVAEHGDTYVVAKRQKPVAVIIGIDRYRQLSGTAKHVREIAGKRILNIGASPRLLELSMKLFAPCGNQGWKRRAVLSDSHALRHRHAHVNPSYHGPEEKAWPESAQRA